MSDGRFRAESSRSGVLTPHEADPGPSRSETKGRHPIRLRRASSLPGSGLGTFTAGHPHEAALLFTTKCLTVFSRQAGSEDRGVLLPLNSRTGPLGLIGR